MKKNVRKKILGLNEQYARENSRILAENKCLCFNMISSPGSGKTTILTKTITQLKNKMKIGVIEGDIQTDLDAEKIRATRAPAVQIQTGGACHLSAEQVSRALQQLPLKELDLIIIENVGNLVCPSSFVLGEHGKLVVLSVSEGDDKPAKYPKIFAISKVLLINKTDLLQEGANIDFNTERVKTDARKLNKDLEIFLLSAKTEQGIPHWCDWLETKVQTINT